MPLAIDKLNVYALEGNTTGSLKESFKMTIRGKVDTTCCVPGTELYFPVNLYISPLACGPFKGENHISFNSLLPILIDTGT